MKTNPSIQERMHALKKRVEENKIRVNQATQRLNDLREKFQSTLTS